LAKMMQRWKGLGRSRKVKETSQELQLLGVYGIVREAFNILYHSSRSKVLRAFAITLLLPLSAATVASNFIFGYQVQGVVLPIGMVWDEFTSNLLEFLAVVAAYIAFGFALSMLATVTVVYSVTSVYTANTKELKLTYVRILKADVPRVWKRLSATFLWFLLISLGFLAAYSFPITVLHHFFGWFSVPFICGVVVIVVVVLGPHVYVTTVLHLATVISVLEENNYGLAAMKKSSELLKGKRWMAFALVILNGIAVGVIGGLSVYVAVMANRGQSVEMTIVYGIVLAVWLCFVNMMGLLTQGVFYFVCKSYHRESIDDNSSIKFYIEERSIQLGRPHADV